MIQEHHDHIDDDFRVSVPVVHPWTRYPVCQKCNASIGDGVRILRRLLAAWGRCSHNTAWCRGDQNSQVKVPTLNIGTGEMGFGSVQVPCFGIVDEHLHIKCARCGFDWLMAVKGGK